MANKKNLPNIPIYIGDWESKSLIKFNDVFQYKKDFSNCVIRSKWSKSSSIPKDKGVYAVDLIYKTQDLEGVLEIVYIGKATNLKKRLQSHHVISLLKKLSNINTFIVRVWWFKSDKNRQLEIDLISDYKPRLNINYVN